MVIIILNKAIVPSVSIEGLVYNSEVIKQLLI